MPPRLSKRQQREEEELMSLAGPSSPHGAGKSDASEEDESSPANTTSVARPVALGFAAVS